MEQVAAKTKDSSSPGVLKRPFEPETDELSRKKPAHEDIVLDSGIVLSAGSRLISRLSEFRLQEKLIDVTVVCGMRHFPCHRNVLAAGSDYFLTLFDGHFADSASAVCRVSAEDATPEALSKVIDFLYEGKVACCEDDLQPLGAASSFLRIDKLMHCVATAMKARVSVYNCVATWTFADKYAIRELATGACRFVATHFQAVSTGGGVAVSDCPLMALPSALMNEILAREDLRPRSEQVVYDVALRWMRSQPKLPSDDEVAKMMAHVRVALLPRETALAMLHEPLLAGTACRELLLRAFIPAAHGAKPQCRLPDTVNEAKEMGFSAARCAQAEMPALDIFNLCKPVSQRRSYGGTDVITASGMYGTFTAQWTGHHHFNHYQNAWDHKFTPQGSNHAEPIQVENVRLLEWA